MEYYSLLVNGKILPIQERALQAFGNPFICKSLHWIYVLANRCLPQSIFILKITPENYKQHHLMKGVNETGDKLFSHEPTRFTKVLKKK